MSQNPYDSPKILSSPTNGEARHLWQLACVQRWLIIAFGLRLAAYPVLFALGRDSETKLFEVLALVSSGLYFVSTVMMFRL